MKAKLNKITKQWDVVDMLYSGAIFASFDTRAQALKWIREDV